MKTGTQTSGLDACPSWCTVEHGVLSGEDDHLHTGDQLKIADDVVTFLCYSVDPTTGQADGPRVMINSTECSPEEIRSLALVLLTLATTADP